MTLTMAWVRLAGKNQELVVASDSRLRAGYAWDSAPKLLPLPRGDAVLAFAGATEFAYPMMLQGWNAINSFSRSRDRTQPLPVLKGHLLRVFNRMLSDISDLPRFERAIVPGAIFLLAGYSWSEQRYRIWTLYYDPNIGRFTFSPASPWRGKSNRGKVVAIVGDELESAKIRLVELLRARKKLTTGWLDYEPLEVLESMIADKMFPTIGGRPQVVKVYQSLNTVPFILRDEGSGSLSLLGRPFLSYEYQHQHPILKRTGAFVAK